VLLGRGRSGTRALALPDGRPGRRPGARPFPLACSPGVAITSPRRPRPVPRRGRPVPRSRRPRSGRPRARAAVPPRGRARASAVAVIAATITIAASTTVRRGISAIARPVSLLAATEASVGVCSSGSLGPFNGDSRSKNRDTIKIAQSILGISPVLVLYKTVASLHIAADELAVLVEQIFQVSRPAVDGESSCKRAGGNGKRMGAVSRLNWQAGTSRAN
jgi:hypothetical protein